MKTYHFILTILVLLPAVAFAQNREGAKKLVDQGIALNDSGKYDQALEKYRQAMTADSLYPNSYYETGYTLFSSGKEKDAIPFIQKLLTIEPTAAEGYDMLGSIYDDMGQSEKALEYYKKGVEVNPKYQRLHFNMAITFYRMHKYPESENAAIEAIKLDPAHASSQRIYAMAAYKQQKRGASLMAWCSFLLLEPQSKRSPEAMAYVKNIINFGISNRTEKGENIKYDVNTGTSGLMMPLAVVEATQGKKNLSAVDSLQLELTSLFKIASSIADDEKKQFAYNYFGTYFEKLANSTQMPAFTHYITLSVYNDEDLAWFKDHDKELKDFQQWVKDTPRNL